MAKDDEQAFSVEGSAGTPPVDPETATGPDDKPLQAREPAQPRSAPRDEVAGGVADPVQGAAPAQQALGSGDKPAEGAA